MALFVEPCVEADVVEIEVEPESRKARRVSWKYNSAGERWNCCTGFG